MRLLNEENFSKQKNAQAAELAKLTKQISTDSIIRRKTIRDNRPEVAGAGKTLWNTQQKKEKEKRKKMKRNDSDNSVHSEQLSPAKKLEEQEQAKKKPIDQDSGKAKPSKVAPEPEAVSEHAVRKRGRPRLQPKILVTKEVDLAPPKDNLDKQS